MKGIAYADVTVNSLGYITYLRELQMLGVTGDSDTLLPLGWYAYSSVFYSDVVLSF